MAYSSWMRMGRRRFLGAAGAAGLGSWSRLRAHTHREAELHAGEGVVDITPPLGMELGGYHRSPGNERRVQGIRQNTAARALVLRQGQQQAAMLSIDIASVSSDFTHRVQQRVNRQTGIPAENVRVCATHTHSMPAFSYLRQWGAIPVDYKRQVEGQCVEAVVRAMADLAPAELSLGKSRAHGANFNRTTADFRTDEEFTTDSDDSQRWLDTLVQLLLFQRVGEKRDLLWYHFSAHPVCFADTQAGPDWPGTVAERVRDSFGLEASFLCGHAGDVNPGDGEPWRGDVEKTTRGVFDAICRALDALEPVRVEPLRCLTQPYGVPLDRDLFHAWREAYREAPEQCARGHWVNAGFAADWYQGNVDRDLTNAHHTIRLSALQLGAVALVFHPAELYSVYGLMIRRDSPFEDTLAVGYCDDIIGYLTDPTAYARGEYAALTVPKILDIPPFTPDAAREFTEEVRTLLVQLKG